MNLKNEDKKYFDVCRVCLSKETANISLFEKFKNSFLYVYINNITNIQIKKGDGMPDMICSPCFVELKIIVNFIEKCKSSNYLLISKTYKTQISSELLIKKEEHTKTDYLAGDNWNEDISLSTGFHSNYDSKTHDIKSVLYLEKDSNGALISEIQCHSCVETFKSKYELMIHWNKTHALKEGLHKIKDQSTDCDESKDSVGDSGMGAVQILAKFQCHDCGELFKSKCKLRVHWKKTHLINSFVCPICKRIFKSYKTYNSHLKKKPKTCTFVTNGMVNIIGIGKARIFHCKLCNFKSRRVKDVQTHLLTHSGERPFQCELCSKTFTQLSSLHMHKEFAHKEFKKEITCHFCGKIVKGRIKAFRHLRMHTENKIPCPICKMMLKKESLKSHMERHSGKRSYACEKCPSTFITKAELCNHKRKVHDKHRNKYNCDLCEYKSDRNHTLKIHKMKHILGNLPCTICGMFFPNVEKLAQHERIHFEEKKYSCPHCDAKFHSRDSVPKHVKRKHKNLISDNCKSDSVVVKEEILDVKIQNNEEIASTQTCV